MCRGPMGNGLNTEDCVVTGKGGYIMGELSDLLCNHTTASYCPALYGLFVATKGWNGGAECGVLEGRYCAIVSSYTSGPGSVYSVSTRSAQYYGLCA